MSVSYTSPYKLISPALVYPHTYTVGSEAGSRKKANNVGCVL
jgi:hypothetical protein